MHLLYARQLSTQDIKDYTESLNLQIHGKEESNHINTKPCDNMNQVPDEHGQNNSFCLGRRIKEKKIHIVSKGPVNNGTETFQHM